MLLIINKKMPLFHTGAAALQTNKLKVENTMANFQDTDEELLATLKTMARGMRAIAALGYVQIIKGDDEPPSPPYSEARKARIRKLWPRLSRLDQETLATREGFPAK